MTSIPGILSSLFYFLYGSHRWLWSPFYFVMPFFFPRRIKIQYINGEQAQDYFRILNTIMWGRFKISPGKHTTSFTKALYVLRFTQHAQKRAWYLALINMGFGMCPYTLHNNSKSVVVTYTLSEQKLDTITSEYSCFMMHTSSNETIIETIKKCLWILETTYRTVWRQSNKN